MSNVNLLRMMKRARCGEFNCLCACITLLGQSDFREMVTELTNLSVDEFDLVASDIQACVSSKCDPNSAQPGSGGSGGGGSAVPMSDCLAALKKKVCAPATKSALLTVANIVHNLTSGDPNIAVVLGFVEAMLDLCESDPTKAGKTKGMVLASGETVQASLSDRVCGYWSQMSAKMGKLPAVVTSALTGFLTSSIVTTLDTCCVVGASTGATTVTADAIDPENQDQQALKHSIASATARLLRNG